MRRTGRQLGRVGVGRQSWQNKPWWEKGDGREREDWGAAKPGDSTTGKTWPTKKPGRARPAEAECNGPKQVQKAGRQERKKGKGRGCQAGSLPSWCQLAVPTAAAAAYAAMAGPPRQAQQWQAQQWGAMWEHPHPLAAGGQQPQGTGHKGQTQQKGAEKGLNAAPYLLELSSFACMPLIYVFHAFMFFHSGRSPKR